MCRRGVIRKVPNRLSFDDDGGNATWVEAGGEQVGHGVFGTPVYEVEEF